MKISNVKQYSEAFTKSSINFAYSDETYNIKIAHKIFNEIITNNLLKSSVLLLIGTGKTSKITFELMKIMLHNQIRVNVFFLNKHIYELSELSQFANFRTITSEMIENNSSELVIDGLFGLGLSKPFTSEIENLINVVNHLHAKKVSLNLPTGIVADQTTIDSNAIIVDYSFCLESANISFFATNIKKFRGQLILINIFPEDNFDFGVFSDEIFVEQEVILENQNKYTNGVSIIIGGQTYPGATILATQATFYSRPRFTMYLATESLGNALFTLVPEAVAILNKSLQKTLQNYVNQISALCIGCGEVSSSNLDIIINVLKLTNTTVIIDGFAINQSLIDQLQCPKIITPHEMEFARLVNLDLEEVQKNRLQLAISYAQKNNLIVVLKGSQTIVTNGYKSWINQFGNPHMATPGMGDVLSGMITSSINSNDDMEMIFTKTCYQVQKHSQICDMLLENKQLISATNVINTIKHNPKFRL